jgi:hypothetical protein
MLIKREGCPKLEDLPRHQMRQGSENNSSNRKGVIIRSILGASGPERKK